MSTIVPSDLDMRLVTDPQSMHQIRGVLTRTIQSAPALAMITQHIGAEHPSYTLQWVDHGDDYIRETSIPPDVAASYASFLDEMFAQGYVVTPAPVLFVQAGNRDGDIAVFIARADIAQSFLAVKTRVAIPGPRVEFNPFLMELMGTLERTVAFAVNGANPIIHVIMAIFGIVFSGIFVAYVSVMGTTIIPRIANAMQSIPWFASTDYIILYALGMLFSVTDIFVFLTARMRTLTIVGWVSQGIGGVIHLWYGLAHPMGSDFSHLVLSAILSIGVAFGGELALIFLFLTAMTLLPATVSFPARLIDMVRSRRRVSRRTRRGYGAYAPSTLVEDIDAGES